MSIAYQLDAVGLSAWRHAAGICYATAAAVAANIDDEDNSDWTVSSISITHPPSSRAVSVVQPMCSRQHTVQRILGCSEGN